jgi:DNA-binding NtrC family response regulator
MDNRNVASSSGGTILLATLDEVLFDLFSPFLRRQGYTVIKATTAEEAAVQFQRNKGAIDLLLTDLICTGAIGTDLLKQIESSMPQIRVLHMTLDSNHNYQPFIEKPFSREKLLREIQKVTN